MLNMLRRISSRLSNRAMTPRLLVAFVLGASVLPAVTPLAQQQPVHLNPVVAKLAEGKTVTASRPPTGRFSTPAKPRAQLSISFMRTWSTTRSTSRRFSCTSWE